MRRVREYAGRFTGFERDARRFLLVTLVGGAAISLWWIDFNLYLAAIGVPRPTIGLIATGGSLAGALVAFPASALSDRLGRRLVIVGATLVMAAAVLALQLTDAVPVIAVLAALFSAGTQAIFVVQAPFLSERSRPEHRSELFSLQFALMNLTNVGAALIGGLAAAGAATLLGFEPDGPLTYRLVLGIMAGLLLAAVLVAATLRDDRPSRLRQPEPPAVAGPGAFGGGLGGPAAAPSATPPAGSPGTAATSPGAGRRLRLPMEDRARFARLVLPNFLIALGAGQIIPFLNLFVQGKFGLDLASLNAVFALTSFGTMAAILLQPALAARLGRVASVVAVQAASIPFLVVLGFSPVLWTVVLAMAVRNSLMNAGNPILNAFAMDQVRPGERATLSATMTVLWSLGWVIGGPYYALLQGTLGFEAGYAVNFLTIIVLYSLATSLYWLWFRDAEPRPGDAAATAPTD